MNIHRKKAGSSRAISGVLIELYILVLWISLGVLTHTRRDWLSVPATGHVAALFRDHAHP